MTAQEIQPPVASAFFIFPADIDSAREHLIEKIEEVKAKRLRQIGFDERDRVVVRETRQEFKKLLQNARSGNPSVLIALCDMHGIGYRVEGVI